jgi:uncharacterized protein YutE (UPF0331/DUF86 family)
MIQDKLKRLEDNLRNLNTVRKEYKIEDFQNDKIDEWGLRYGLFESIQLIIDLACSIVTQKNLGIPNNYSDCIQLLITNNYLDNDLGERIKNAVGLRNLLAHEYGIIDIKRLYSYLEHIEDLRNFALIISRIKL